TECPTGQFPCGTTCCSSGQTCSNGSCLTGCPSGQTQCGTNCCSSGQTCSNGTCVTTCPSGQTLCGKTCCPAGFTCSNGTCTGNGENCLDIKGQPTVCPAGWSCLGCPSSINGVDVTITGCCPPGIGCANPLVAGQPCEPCALLVC